MALNIDPNSVFPTYELLEPKQIDSSDLAQDETSSLFVTQPKTGTVVVENGALTSVAIHATDNGKFYTSPPSISATLSNQSEQAQVNSSGDITILGAPNGVDKSVSLGNIPITIATKAALANNSMADSDVDIVWDADAKTAITGVSATATALSGNYDAIRGVKTGDTITIVVGGNSTTLTHGSDFTDPASLQTAIQGISGIDVNSTFASGAFDIKFDVAASGAQPTGTLAQSQTVPKGAVLTASGTTDAANASILNYSFTPTSGSGTGLEVELNTDGSGVPTITITTPGAGYAINDTFTIDAAGSSGSVTNDITVTITSVENQFIDAAAAAPINFVQGSQFVQAVLGGNIKDNVAAQIANVINTRADLSDYSATSNDDVVTVEFTGTNGADPTDVLGNAKELTKTGAWCSVSDATLSGGSVAIIKPTVSALTTDGIITSYNVDNAGSGIASADNLSFGISLPDTEAIEKIAAAGADIATGGATFSYDKKYIAVGLSDLVVGSSSSNPNSLTEVEASEAGDMRKICYHLIRRFYDYLNEQNSIISITIANAGLNYTTADTIEVSGGGQSSAYSFNITVDANGAINGVTYSGKSHLTDAVAADATNVGKGFTSTPTVVISSSTGSGASASAVLTDNIPSKFSVGRSGISENVVTGELSRTYQANFTFNESGLEVSNEA